MTTEEIWNEFSAQLKRFIRRRVSDEAQADDILQDVFIKIHTRLGALKESDRLQSWIYQIARNAIIDHYRAHKPSDELPLALSAPETDPLEQARQEGLQCLRPLIQNLPERYRQTIMLSEIEERSHKEISDRLGLSVSGVKSRVQRGRALMKEMILGSCRFEFDSRGIPIDYDGKSGCGNHCGGEASN